MFVTWKKWGFMRKNCRIKPAEVEATYSKRKRRKMEKRLQKELKRIGR